MSLSTSVKAVSWAETEEAVSQLCLRLPSGSKGVYGIPRGGIVLATMISYRTGLPLLMAPIAGCVVIDDVADTGETLLHYANKYTVMTMYQKSWSQVDAIHWKECDDWLVFPWEGKE